MNIVNPYAKRKKPLTIFAPFIAYKTLGVIILFRLF